jgi:hypothetical protein
MAVLNYTTSISASKTVGEMQAALAQAGAGRISVDYDDASPCALSFMLATPHGARHFTLPVNVDAMHRLLVAEDKAGRIRSGSKATRSSREQAERVAWRVMKDWLLAQLALVATEMAGLDQVMLPYLQIDDAGRTLYASYKERETTATLMLQAAE